MGDRSRGLYGKFFIQRTDGQSAPGSKHDGCDYFVLDLTHDKHAAAALLAYADSCAEEYPLLAADLRAKMTPNTTCDHTFEDRLARACMAVEIPDSKYESLLIALNT